MHNTILPLSLTFHATIFYSYYPIEYSDMHPHSPMIWPYHTLRILYFRQVYLGVGVWTHLVSMAQALCKMILLLLLMNPPGC